MCKQVGMLIIALTVAQSTGNAGDIVDTAVENGSFKTLVAAVQAAGLVDTLRGEGPFTVFAPTDEAFAKLPKGTVESLLQPENKDQLVGILTYHVVPGKVPANKAVTLSGTQTVNGQRIDINTENGVQVDAANVIATDVQCSNGIIHVIDAVLLPASDPIPTVATNAKQFTTLVAAAQAAGLVDVLAGEGPFTVFAPTDEAFSKLPKGTVETLLQPENKQRLVDLLKYHVVSGRVYSDAALNAGQAKTLQGGMLDIEAASGNAKVNNAKLVKTDIDASNGVIHVIDAVLMPSADAKQSSTHKIPAATSHTDCTQPVSVVVRRCR